jgi:hypothetical protein
VLDFGKLRYVFAGIFERDELARPRRRKPLRIH